jgi:hypothetical protein
MTNIDDRIAKLFNRLNENDQEKMTNYMALMEICRELGFKDKNPITNACINNIEEWT